jgi:hypothetical protein
MSTNLYNSELELVTRSALNRPGFSGESVV